MSVYEQEIRDILQSNATRSWQDRRHGSRCVSDGRVIVALVGTPPDQVVSTVLWDRDYTERLDRYTRQQFAEAAENVREHGVDVLRRWLGDEIDARPEDLARIATRVSRWLDTMSQTALDGPETADILPIIHLGLLAEWEAEHGEDTSP